MLELQCHWSLTGHWLLCCILPSRILDTGLAISKENTRVLTWQPLLMFYGGIYHPQPTQIPPPTATKNSPSEKCYYEKGWLLCDSHCFIKKILFKQVFSRGIQRFFQSHSKTEQLIILFCKGLPFHGRFLCLKILETIGFPLPLCATWPLG